MSEWAMHWAPEAREDLRGVVEFISAQGDGTNAIRVFDRIVARVNSLATSPERGRKAPELKFVLDPPLRQVIERPWRILYVCERERVVIAAIIDGRRDVVAALEGRFGPGFPDLP